MPQSASCTGSVVDRGHGHGGAVRMHRTVNGLPYTTKSESMLRAAWLCVAHLRCRTHQARPQWRESQSAAGNQLRRLSISASTGCTVWLAYNSIVCKVLEDHATYVRMHATCMSVLASLMLHRPVGHIHPATWHVCCCCYSRAALLANAL